MNGPDECSPRCPWEAKWLGRRAEGARSLFPPPQGRCLCSHRRTGLKRGRRAPLSLRSAARRARRAQASRPPRARRASLTPAPLGLPGPAGAGTRGRGSIAPRRVCVSAAHLSVRPADHEQLRGLPGRPSLAAPLLQGPASGRLRVPRASRTAPGRPSPGLGLLSSPGPPRPVSRQSPPPCGACARGGRAERPPSVGLRAGI